MSEAATAASSERISSIVRELRVSGRLMTLEPGLFCIVHTPSPNVDAAAGLPGVRVSLPPGPSGRPEAVAIASFRNDGWLHGVGDAALVRVTGGPAQVLVTVYQSPEAQGGGPNLQVTRLTDGAAAMPGQPGLRQAGPQGQAAAAAPIQVDMIAHIQGRGDVGAQLGEWLGEQGSKRWIEGFAVAPAKEIAAGDVEYQAVLGRGWLSPWAEGGQFCGSRGMALPLLGLRLRLRGAAAEAYECSYSAAFVDGTTVGPVTAGEACESEALAPMESFRIDIRPRGQAPATLPAEPVASPAEAARRAARSGRAAAVAAKPPGAKPASKPATPIGRGPASVPRRRT
jgi:hypothetical protein